MYWFLFFFYRCPGLKLWVFQTPIRPKLWRKCWCYLRSISGGSQEKSRKLWSPIRQNQGSHILQANFQMACTRANLVFLQCHLPEKKSSNTFFIPRNDLLIDVLKEITDHILHRKILCKKGSKHSFGQSNLESDNPVI